MRKLVIVLATLFVATLANAVEIAGVTIAEKASVGGQELVLNGAGMRTKLFVKVYVGSLYLPAKAAELAGVLGAAPRRIQLNVMRTLSADQLIDALVDGLKANNSPEELAAVSKEMVELVATLKALNDVKEKDVVTFDFVDGTTKIALNGTPKSSIGGDAFNRALTKIWLGEHPVQADLKKKMLGG